MLDSSDVVALVQYTINGDFRASAKVITVYKGQLKAGDGIWISGFSNRYGPIDKVRVGDRYLVFLKLNYPNVKQTEYLNKELNKDKSLQKFVDAFKNRKAYYVWSPTSGDLRVKAQKVQYDLTQSTYYAGQIYYPLSGFEAFLNHYFDRRQSNRFCDAILEKILPPNNTDSNCQMLMQLFLLGYNQYHDAFFGYTKVKNSSSKYALAQLMGNIRSEQSRNILIALLDDKNSLVEGETVRQLKNEPSEIIAPILLQHLRSSSNLNFGALNIMDPVLNAMDGGRTEIIKTLGEWKYKPAVPDLLALLETKDEDLFQLSIEALKKIGSRAYIKYINRHLDVKTDALIFRISMIIAEDSLVECLGSFKNFISTCNRNTHSTYDYTISTCCGIGHFTDTSTINFLLSDYERFFNYKDSLESSKQKEWTRQYIKTFTDLRVREARPLIYKSLYDWYAINEDFSTYPILFTTKKELEDSLGKAFNSSLREKGYKLNYCLAFIENTAETAKGGRARTKFIIEATIPSIEKAEQDQVFIAKQLGLSQDNVYLRFNNGTYYLDIQDRFDKSISATLLEDFVNYAKATPNEADVEYLKAILENGFVQKDFQEEVKEGIIEIKKVLQN